MEKKYTIQDLAALLAERESLPLEQAEDFVRTFFELAEEGLLKDSFVKVTGFGTFKLVEVSERESVNINTGERFQISGHNKISFTPDGTLRELINRPFAHFTTITLNDNTPEAELEAAEQLTTENVASTSKVESQPAETHAASPSFAPTMREEKTQVANNEGENTTRTAVHRQEVQSFPLPSGENNIESETTRNKNTENSENAATKLEEPATAHPVSVVTSPLLQRPTPVPVIDGALLVSQTPSPVLNNELLSELLTETPDTTAAIGEEHTEEAPAHQVESESQAKILSSVSAPLIEMEVAEEATTVSDSLSSPVSLAVPETTSETQPNSETSHGPAQQFVPTREALQALTGQKSETPQTPYTPNEQHLRDQYRYPVDIEIKHSDSVQNLSESPVENTEVPVEKDHTEEKELTPSCTKECNPTDAPPIAIPAMENETEEKSASCVEIHPESLPSDDKVESNTSVAVSNVAIPSIEFKSEEEIPATTPEAPSTNVADDAEQTTDTELAPQANVATATTTTDEQDAGDQSTESESSDEQLPLEVLTTEAVSTSSDQPSDNTSEVATESTSTSSTTVTLVEHNTNIPRRKRGLWGKMLGVLLLLLLLLCCLFGYLCYSHTITPQNLPAWLHPLYQLCAPTGESGREVRPTPQPSKNTAAKPAALTPAQRATIAKAKADSAAAAEKAAAEREAAAAQAAAEQQARVRAIYARAARYPQVKDGSMLIIGTHAVHKMKVGDNLYILAERTYGSRSYAKYIIRYNNIANPDFIKVNKVLKLPKLVNPKNIK